MQAALNDLLLNEIVHVILFLALLVLYVNSLWESRVQPRVSDRQFSYFILAFTVYIGLMLPWLWLSKYGMAPWLFWGLIFVRVLAATAAYSFVGCWLISLVDAKTPVPEGVQKGVRYVPYVLFALFLLIIIIGGDTPTANLPLFLNYVFLEALIIKYREALGFASVSIITMYIIPTLFLQVQEWWNYTPANIYVVLVTMLIYSRMWVAEKERYLANQQLYALQKAELENAKTRLVLSQIKPHFIYNTLGSIAYLCTKQPEQARSLTLDFSTYLRGNLHSLDSSELVPFGVELDHVKSYLKIECVRFKHILQVQYDIKTVNFKLPALTVEPLVENAVKHGVCKKLERSTVTIATREQADCYRVVVQDDGVGFDMRQIDNFGDQHVGLRSVRQRVELLCRGAMQIDSSPGKGTIIILTIPK